ncbi:MAG: hypothetical protein CMN87_20340 [Stappia sp.]|uniref:acyltransferase family protein n=1 Tax=Stappia sp. TaxID=1870903 RepID=UPI000C5C32C7|nr:acyltransferase [Stappia sp.]MAA98020.1 hypothetical protein [Stappia sp.]MBM22357.1 hypothetical protein [Stappia sp.]
MAQGDAQDRPDGRPSNTVADYAWGRAAPRRTKRKVPRSPATARPPAMRRPGLDLLRVLAVAAVAWFHFGFRMQVTGEAGEALVGDPGGLARYGYLGVSVFFAISGYVITMSTEGRDPIAFAVARFARLWPVFLACMTLTALVTLATPGFGFTVTLPQVLANATMLAPFLGQPLVDGAYWSIVVEIIFYGWVFVLMSVGLWHRHRVMIAIMWVLLAGIENLWLDSDLLRKLLLLEFAGVFAFGIALRAWEHGEPMALPVTMVALLQAVSSSINFAKSLAPLYDEPFSILLAAMFTLGGLLLLALLTRVPEKALPTRLCAVAGRATYPFYLLHQHIGYAGFLLLTPLAGFAGAATIIVAALTAMALFLTLTLERPAGRLLREAGDRLDARFRTYLAGGRAGA